MTHTREPELVLVKSIKEMDREEIEAHLSLIRMRRMSAALEYAAGKNLKLGKSADKVKQKLERQYDMLGKEIDRLDVMIDKVEQRMIEIESLKQELGMIVESIVPNTADEEE